ncbi:MAG: peptide chain release factor N(5)-glutamine methyltransferase [Methylophilaceae bacterium]|nr:peptide chain release factor N(5)-glutamine methyltransferase [Methylophilaceae bacterium]MBL6726932.1 peptide chain release factor N(5)-glutamine methyltransferase [Methylophilaceae bacterium]MBL6791124.1 peptide chain release factor N(5)-glutamine methyltransferase [Methylophilaceae bacterium]
MTKLNIATIENFIFQQLEESLNLPKRELMLETKMILLNSLEVTSTDLIINKKKSVSEKDYHQIKRIIDQRKTGKPLAYIFGEWDFYGQTFYVNKNTLIPRPDTELLIDIAFDTFDKTLPLKILDLGSGSGVIGITLANHYLNSQIFLSDISMNALKIAKKNAAKFNKKITLIRSDWFKSIDEHHFNLIVSNPPYINKNEQHLVSPELKFEPNKALYANEDGLGDIKSICARAKEYLITDGILMLEHGFNQASDILDIFKKNNYKNIKQFKDINQKLRVTLGFK